MTLKPGQQQGIEPTDLKTRTDQLHASMVKALKVVGTDGEAPGCAAAPAR